MASTKHNRLLWHYLLQGGKCFYCKKELWNGQILIDCNIDHKLPTSRGGKDDEFNTCLSCVSCNSLKGNMTVEEFSTIPTLIENGKITAKQIPKYQQYLVLKGEFENI